MRIAELGIRNGRPSIIIGISFRTPNSAFRIMRLNMPSPTHFRIAFVLLAAVMCLPSRSVRSADDTLLMFPKDGPRVPLGLTPIMWPKDNTYTPEKAELGWLLYFDNRLSVDNTVSCASCHAPQFAFTDGQKFS